MKIYYTAKDIEELAAKGVRRLEIGPLVTLTDVARETAQAFNIELVQTAGAAQAGSTPAFSGSAERYNKPAACQHGPAAPAATPAAAPVAERHNKPAITLATPAVTPAAPAPQLARRDGPDATTMNKLIDLVGKVMKRGG